MNPVTPFFNPNQSKNMETLLAILQGLNMLKFAILAIPERQWYIVAFVTPIILIGVAVLKEIRAYNRLKNENS